MNSRFNELANVRLASTRLRLVHELRGRPSPVEERRQRIAHAEREFEAALDYMLPLDKHDNLRGTRK